MPKSEYAVKMLALVIMLGVVGFLAACGSNGDDKPLTENPDIRGLVTNSSPGCSAETPGVFLIEGEMEADTQYARASVNVGEARAYRQEGADLVEIGACDIALGDRVEAWFTGALAESDPVQARAKQVTVLE